MGSPLKCDKVMIERPYLTRLRIRTFKSEPQNFDLIEDGGDGKRKSDTDDISICDMTLKELKERCKKRKLQKSANLKKENISTATSFDIKQDFSNVKIEEEDSDLEKPIITWKRRSPSKDKARQKSVRKQVCSSIDLEVPGEVITSQILSVSEDAPPSVTNKHDSPNIKSKILESDCSEFQNVECVTNGSAPEYHATDYFFQKISDEMPKSVMENLESISLTKESPSCVVNEASFENTEFHEPKSLSSSETVHFEEVTEIGVSQIISHKSVSVPLSEMTEKFNNINLISDCNLEEMLPATWDLSSDIRESCEDYSFQPHISCHIDSNAVIEVMDMTIIDNFQCKEHSFGGSNHVSAMKGEVYSNEETPSHLKDSNVDNSGSLHLSSIDSYSLSSPSCMAIDDSFQCKKPNSGDSTIASDLKGEVDSNEDIRSHLKDNNVDNSGSFHFSSVNSYPLSNLSTMANDNSFQYKESSSGGSSLVSDLKGQVDHNEDTSCHLKDDNVDNSGNLLISSTDSYPSTNSFSGRAYVYNGSPIAEMQSICTLVPAGTNVGEGMPNTFLNAGDGYVYDGSPIAEMQPIFTNDEVVPAGANGAEDVPKTSSNASDGYEYDGSPVAEMQSICTIDEDVAADANRAADAPKTFPNASDGYTAIEVFDSQLGIQLDFLPKRLLSTRQAISPTSQEKLRQAMDVEELGDNIRNSESHLEGVKVTTSPGVVDIKPKKNWNGTPKLVPKGILKAPDDSRVQKAVEFSQQQMRDIESLAVKLMKELESMKGIVEESLCANESSSTPKYTADEMRIAIQSSAEVENTTKRWLSMMAKDCNRFCKIMRSTGKKTAAEKKKIIFADEAGGLLCHVKVLEDCLDSVSLRDS
ncbi:hypothetical protein FRX31_020611 [Thalictrum thalictroides]|uniref:Uncharacterized protein n=1 Tax=Thalictrum thalictroides TaxID=46969 RepID=A0A7J6VYN5_THATH|nr:hypothetical protein FRX31_020611 [Thalictrum thalictroides]